MAASPTPDGGPSESPPSLPPGWIAQWDSKTREYYFVAISTGVSTWKVPTDPAPGVPSPQNTPLPTGNQFQPPEESRGQDGQESDRGLGSMAMNMLMSKHSNQNQQSGFSSLAQSFLGGNTQGNTGSSSGFSGQLSNLLGGHNKPYGYQNSSTPSQQYGQTGQTGQSQQSGGFLGSLFGGNHGTQQQHQQQQQQNYGYNSSNQNSNGGYTNTPSQSQYQQGAPPQHQNSFAPSNAPYNPTSYSHQPISTNGQYGGPSGNSAYNGGQANFQAPHYNNQSQYGQPPQNGYSQNQYDQHSQQPDYGGYQQPQGQYGGGYSQGQGPPPAYGQHQPPPPPMDSHPNQGGYGGYGGQASGGYGGQQAPPRW